MKKHLWKVKWHPIQAFRVPTYQFLAFEKKDNSKGKSIGSTKPKIEAKHVKWQDEYLMRVCQWSKKLATPSKKTMPQSLLMSNGGAIWE